MNKHESMRGNQFARKPVTKQSVTVRLPPDMLDWLKSLGNVNKHVEEAVKQYRDNQR